MGKDAKYVVQLENEERQQLQALIDQGGRAAAVLRRARILLKADEAQDGPAWPDECIAEFAEVSSSPCIGFGNASCKRVSRRPSFASQPTIGCIANSTEKAKRG